MTKKVNENESQESKDNRAVSGPNWNFWVVMGIIAILLPIILQTLMTWGWLSNAPGGSDDGWLGFWGSYLGIPIAIGGVYWDSQRSLKMERQIASEQLEQARNALVGQRNDSAKQLQQAQDTLKSEQENSVKDRENTRELEYSRSRPFFLVNEKLLNLTDETTKVYVENIEEVPGITNVVGRHDSSCYYANVLNLINVSDKPLLAVIAVAKLSDGKTGEVKIPRISGNENGAILFENCAKVALNNVKARYDESVSSVDYPAIIEVSIYFTTEIRERIILKYVMSDNDQLVYDENSKKIENRGDDLSEYNLADFKESGVINLQQLASIHGQ